MGTPRVGEKRFPLQREPLPQPPEGPGHSRRVGTLRRQEPQQRQEVLRCGRFQNPAQHGQPAGAQQQPACLVALHTDRNFSNKGIRLQVSGISKNHDGYVWRERLISSFSAKQQWPRAPLRWPGR